MNGLIATTDFDWYRHLSSLPDVDEVNFWQPSSYREIHSIQRGEPLLFKLKAPHNAICGFGLFAGRPRSLPSPAARHRLKTLLIPGTVALTF